MSITTVYKSEPSVSASAVTPSDSTTFSPIPRGLYVGTGGNLAVLMANDTLPVTFENVAGGTILPLQVTKVMSTNTTADDIVALF